MATETLGTCEKHQLPLDLHGECQLCRLSGMPSQAPPSGAGKWVMMTLVALMAGVATWVVASFEPSEGPTPSRGVPNAGMRGAAPAIQDHAPRDQAVAPAPLPPTEDEAALEEAPTEPVPVEEADGQAQEWAQARDEVEVIMYATSACEVCRQAREYMQSNEIEFTEFNIDEDKDADRRIRELSPERTTPTFEVDDVVFIGFSPDNFEATRTQAASKHLSENSD